MNKKKTGKYCLFLLIPALMVVFLYGGGSAGEVMAKTFSTLLPTTTATMSSTEIAEGDVIPTTYTWANAAATSFTYADTNQTPPATANFSAPRGYRAGDATAGVPYTVSEVQPSDYYWITWSGFGFAESSFPTETLVTVQTMYPTDLETADPASIDKSAKTGDNNSFIWIALALLALSGGVVCYILRKKTVKENK